MTFNVLSLDGGGIRGVFTARLLQRLVDRRPNLLSQVKLFSGTSTGGILALGLAAGMQPTELLALYRDHAAAIFQKRWFGGVWGAKYSNAGLKAALVKTFGEKRLSSLRAHVVIPTFDLDAPPRPGRPRTGKAKFFESINDAAASVVDVALATTAAPTFFPSHKGYIDGGVVALNPAASAAAQALAWRQPAATIRVLSLGTGSAASWIEGDELDWGVPRWASKLPTIFMDGVADVVDYQLEQLLGRQYHRLDAVLSKPVAMDDVTALEPLVELADKVNLDATLTWLEEGQWTR